MHWKIALACAYRKLHPVRKCGAKDRIVSSSRSMLGAIELLWHWLVSLLKSRRRLEAEVLCCAIS